MPCNIFLRAYVNKDNLHAFQSNFFFQEVLKCQTVYYGEIIAHFLRNVHHKTCVAVFIISRKIGGLLRSLSVGTLICGASLISGGGGVLPYIGYMRMI